MIGVIVICFAVVWLAKEFVLDVWSRQWKSAFARIPYTSAAIMAGCGVDWIMWHNAVTRFGISVVELDMYMAAAACVAGLAIGVFCVTVPLPRDEQ